MANSMYDIVEKYQRKLEGEVQKFKLELEADSPGITHQLEQSGLYSYRCCFSGARMSSHFRSQRVGHKGQTSETRNEKKTESHGSKIGKNNGGKKLFRGFSINSGTDEAYCSTCTRWKLSAPDWCTWQTAKYQFSRFFGAFCSCLRPLLGRYRNIAGLFNKIAQSQNF